MQEIIDSGIIEIALGLVLSHFGIKVLPVKSTGIISLIKNILKK